MNDTDSAVDSSTPGGKRSNATRWLSCQITLPSSFASSFTSYPSFRAIVRTKNSSYGSTIVPCAHHPNNCCIITCITFQYNLPHASRAAGCPARSHASRVCRITSPPLSAFSPSNTETKRSHIIVNTAPSSLSALSIAFTAPLVVPRRSVSCSSFKISSSYSRNLS